MKPVTRFEQLEAWQESRRMVRTIYALSDAGPFSRDFPLRHQIRRSAISVMGNIAEGFEREGNREFIQSLSITKASCREVRSHLYVAHDAGYTSDSLHEEPMEQVECASRLIAGLTRYLKRSARRGRKFE